MYGFNVELAFKNYFGYDPFWDKWTEEKGWEECESKNHNMNMENHKLGFGK